MMTNGKEFKFWLSHKYPKLHDKFITGNFVIQSIGDTLIEVCKDSGFDDSLGWNDLKEFVENNEHMHDMWLL